MGKFILPLKFLFICIVSILIMLFFSLIYQWGTWVSPSIDLKNSIIVFIPNTAYKVIFPAASAALLFTFFDYRKKAISPVSVVVTAVIIFIILFTGFKSTAALKYDSENYAYQPFNENKLHITDDCVIYVDSISEKDPDAVQNIVVRDREGTLPGFRYYKNGMLQSNPEPVLHIDADTEFKISPKNPVFNESFKVTGPFASYLKDIGALNNALREAAISGGTEFLIIIASITAFLISCLLFRGVTVWPLFEFILILAFHRLVYYLFNLFSKESEFISDLFFGGSPFQHITLFTITGLTLIIFLCGLLAKLTSGRNNR